MNTYTSNIQLAERLTLGVLISGIAALALSDFVSPLYWSLPAIAAAIRWYKGTQFSFTEMQASLIGWVGFVWVGLELMMGRAWVVAFTDFLLILALAVIVEAATPRNHLHRMLTGLFLMLAGAVLTDSVLYTIPLLAFMWFTWRSAICLYGLQQPGGDLPIHTVRTDIKSMLMMLFITSIIFVFLPRFDTHNKLKATQPRMATTGFSDQVKLGDFAHELDASVVLRIEATKKNNGLFQKLIKGRYWRGAVLSQYSHHTWKHSPHSYYKTWRRYQNLDIRHANNNIFAVSMFREASDHAYIFLPDGMSSIAHIPDTIQLDKQGQLVFKNPPSRRLRLLLSITQKPMYFTGLRPPIAVERSPDNIPESIQTWVEQLIPKGTSKQASLDILSNELRSWTYDLHAAIDDAHPIQSFLRTKRGHCELYATTLALAARSLHIPSRMINGYYGGEWNDVGQFLIIRQQHAHSWVEVWLDNTWQRIDPTPASRWQLSGVIFPQWDKVWESVKLTWYRYILEFQSGDREQLFKYIFTWLKTMLPWLVLSVVSIFIMIRCYPWWKKSHSQQYIYSKQLRIVDKWLNAHNIQRPIHTPLRMLKKPEGIPKKDWYLWLSDWEKQRYGNRETWTAKQLKRHLRALSHTRC